MPPPPSSQDSFEAESPSGGFQLGDIYYVLFRHKWKILFCALAGLVAAGVLYKFKSPLYSSYAKLLVHYVVDSRMFPTANGDVRTPDSRGETIMNAEIEILTSFDLLQEVAEAVGADRIVGAAEPTNDVNWSAIAAAARIQSGLKISPPGRGSVLAVEFQHADPWVAQEVLRKLVDLYFAKHRSIHRAPGVIDDALARKADESRLKLADIEERLRKLKSSANIVSIEDTMKAYLAEISHIRTDLFSALAELAEKQASLVQLTNQQPVRVTNGGTTNEVPGSVGSPRLDEYRRIVSQLELFRKQDQELSTQFTGANAFVREIRAKIEELQREKGRLEQAYAGLIQAPMINPANAGAGAPISDPHVLTAFQDALRVAALTAKIGELTNHLASVQAEAARVGEVENQVRELERQKEIEEAKYKTYMAGQEQSELEKALGPGKLPNISQIQKPTPAGKDFARFYKKVGIVAMGGLGAGLALAFLIELFVDQSVRRPGDLQKKLRLPVFITVPRLNKLRALKTGWRKALKGPETDSGSGLLPAVQSISDTSSVIQPYCDALRDRLVHYFQRNNMTHKPKLVAVTGCGDGSGVSTIAAGLAASLSETGDGNVLLVDTNLMEGAAHPFYRGQLACGLNDVLKEDLRSGAQVQNNLYVAAASESDGALIKALPKRFSQLVPKLKASDYDYIIFDMPPVTQTSITSKLSGYMDMVLLVVESEKTSRSIVAEAADLLHESRANVATVLNRTRRYVPRWVHQEFE